MSSILYGCETRSLTLREHTNHKCLETVLSEIFGPEKGEVRGYWKAPDKILHLHCCYFCLAIRAMCMDGDIRNEYRNLVGERRPKGPLEKPKCRTTLKCIIQF
jgi:hypothetical protein